MNRYRNVCLHTFQERSIYLSIIIITTYFIFILTFHRWKEFNFISTISSTVFIHDVDSYREFFFSYILLSEHVISIGFWSRGIFSCFSLMKIFVNNLSRSLVRKFSFKDLRINLVLCFTDVCFHYLFDSIS